MAFWAVRLTYSSFGLKRKNEELDQIVASKCDSNNSILEFEDVTTTWSWIVTFELNECTFKKENKD